MAKTPVSMTIDGYKEREVLMVTDSSFNDNRWLQRA